MHEERIASLLATLPESEALPELVNIFSRAGDAPRPDWDLPIISCLAVGGIEDDGIVGSAAVACLQISIILVDDMLDDDPKGEYHILGSGPTANTALGFQAAAFRLLDSVELPYNVKSAAASCLANIALATAAGQNLDTSNLTGEENYWRVLEAKSTPFYGGALQLGGILGGADPVTCSDLYKLGVIIGEIIQVEDDLQDSFEFPANPDWTAGRNNLLILYASSAPHPDKKRFNELKHRAEENGNLEEAQQILISSGALSYAAFQLIQRQNNAKNLLAKINLVNIGPIENILNEYAVSLTAFLKKIGVDIPADFPL